jgi:hypothetical protein
MIVATKIYLNLSPTQNKLTWYFQFLFVKPDINILHCIHNNNKIKFNILYKILLYKRNKF